MTEDEAKTKACFKAATFAGSQQIADGPGPHCIGSACMAWRADRRFEYRDLPADQEPGEGWVSDGEGFETGERSWRRERVVTYCGLVGYSDTGDEMPQ